MIFVIQRCIQGRRGANFSIATRSAIDHFIPWARYAENALENLVVAHDRCTGKKRDFFAAPRTSSGGANEPADTATT